MVDDDFFAVHDGVMVYFVSFQGPKDLKVTKQVPLPLTSSSKYRAVPDSRDIG